MANRIQYRRDTAANWTAANPVLALGEPGYETDAGKRKIGDGATAWIGLAYQIDKATADSTYTAKSLPAAAGSRANRFNPELSLYNANPSNMRGFRQLLAKAKSGSLATLAFLGDSKTAGQGTNGDTTTIIAANSMPGQVRQILTANGYPIAGTGPVFAYQNNTVGDTRWSFTGTWTGSSNFRSTTTSGATATFTSNLAGTVVEIRSMNTSGPFTYSIDGAAAVTVTPSGASSLLLTTVTGLANTTHTVVITSTSTTQTYILAVNVRQTTGLQIANHGQSGSQTSSWLATQFYSLKTVAETLPSDGVILSLGTNDAGSNVTTATFKTNMTTIINAHTALGRPVMLVAETAPSATATTNYANWPAYIAAHYDLADTLNLPLLDLTDVQGTHAQASAAGMMFDTLHETSAGYALNANAVVNALQR